MAEGGSRKPPANLEAEASLLGAMMLSNDALLTGLEMVVPADFYKPAHGKVFAAIARIYSRAEKPDPVTIAAELGDDLPSVGGGEALVTIQARTPSTGNAAAYARLVAADAARRRMLAEMSDLAAQVYAGERPVDSVRDDALRRFADVVPPDSSVPPGPDVASFIAEQDPAPDWVADEIIEAQDRVIIIGDEGHGKTTVLYQAAAQVAAGLVPFSQFRERDPQPAMVVDAENPTRLVRRAFRRLTACAGPRLDPRYLTVHSRPDGLDLLGRADRAWLSDRIAANRPRLLVLGPLYRLHRRNPNDEEPAKGVVDFLDGLRTRHGFALLMETHMPHASGGSKHRPFRPFGASLWIRWPEVGIGLVHDSGRCWEVRDFRPPRDERAWPDRLYRGGAWPWLADEPGPHQEQF